MHGTGGDQLTEGLVYELLALDPVQTTEAGAYRTEFEVAAITLHFQFAIRQGSQQVLAQFFRAHAASPQGRVPASERIKNTAPAIDDRINIAALLVGNRPELALEGRHQVHTAKHDVVHTPVAVTKVSQVEIGLVA